MTIFARHFGLFGVDIHEKFLEISVSLLKNVVVILSSNFQKLDATVSNCSEKSTQLVEIDLNATAQSVMGKLKPTSIALFSSETIKQSRSVWTPAALDNLEIKLALEILELVAHVILTQSSHANLDITELFIDGNDINRNDASTNSDARKWWIMRLRSLQLFSSLHGLDLLVSLVHPSFPSCLSEMAIYLLQRFTLLGSLFLSFEINYWPPLVFLIRQSWFPTILKLRVMKAVVSLLNDPHAVFATSNHPPCTNFLIMNQLKVKFASAGGFYALLHLLDACALINGLESAPLDLSSHVPNCTESCELATIALFAVSKAVFLCDANKVFIGENIGFDHFAEVVKRTSITLDSFLFDTIFDFATITPKPDSLYLDSASEFSKTALNASILNLYLSNNSFPSKTNMPLFCSICWSDVVISHFDSVSLPRPMVIYSDKFASSLLEEWIKKLSCL